MATLRTALLLVLVALAPFRDARAQFTLPGSTAVAVTPGQASPGVTITISGSNLKVGTSYTVSLVGTGVDQTLVPAQAATATTRTWKVAVPSVPSGKYAIRLEASARISAGSTPFVVAPALTVTPSTTTPQAGKYIGVTVANLASGSMRLVYGNRTVYGPASVAAGTKTVKLLLPTDYPTSFPANVVLKAENFVGRALARSGVRTLAVSGPYTAPRIAITGLRTSTLTPKLDTPFEVRGTLELKDGVTPDQARTSFFFKGNDGRTFPLNANDYTIDAGGNFVLRTELSEFGWMSAYGVGGGTSGGTVTSGRIVASSAIDHGTDERGEFQLFEGPDLTPSGDIDPAVDINVTVRGPGSIPLANAIVVASAGEGTIVEGKGDVTSNRVVSAREAYRFRSPSQFSAQVDHHDFVQVQFGCPATLERQYTNAQGQVEFHLKDPAETSDLGGN